MRPCPTRIRARAVMARTGSGPVDYIADRVQVIGVSLSSSGDEVDRSEVLDPLAPPRASVVLGRRMASVTIEQEVYGDLSQHAALFRACPVEVTQSGAGIAGSVSSSPSARGSRCTIEIVEVGGNRYRIEDALGVFTMSGAPGERLLLQFDLQGELVPVADAGLAPMALVMPPAPLVYRNASLLASEQTFATCPEFSFDAGMTLGTTDYTCSPDGGRASFVQRDAQAVLALTGVLSGRESVDRHWAAARVPVCDATLDATVWSDGVSSVRVELRECATVDPALADVEGFVAYDLAVGAGAWSLVWDMDEGIPLIINPVGEEIGGSMYVFTESVHVSGSATPDSTITVNGQSVVVGGDGSWSVDLTLPAGQSHVITAKGNDGKVAQTSVYVWGEPDLLALELDVWLDPTDASTLFVDSAGTIPATIGDPVGLWKNKGALGAAGDFVPTVSAQRPIYDGGSVLFDGGGSRMASSYTPTLPCSLFANVDRFGPPPTGGAQRIFATPTALPYIQIGDISTGMNANFAQTGLNAALPNNGGRAIKTIGGEWSTARFRAYVGASFVDGATMPPTNFTTAGPWNINLNGGVQQRVGHVFISDRILTDDERGKLITWLEQRA